MTNVYRIGVQIAMASNGAQLLGVLSRHLTGVHGQVAGLTGGFNKLKLAIGGALAIGAGAAIIGAFKGPLDEARKFEMAVGRFSRFGLGAERTREAAEFAKAMNIAGSTYVENMNRMAEAQGVFRESGLNGEAALRGAKMAAPTLAKIDFANRGLDEETRAKYHGQSMDMMRFIEQRGGLNSPEQFNRIADAGFKAITSSGGNVNWSLLRQFMNTAGVAGRSMSDQALFGELEPIIGELKSRAGTGYMTAYSTFGGLLKPTAQRAREALKLGLWDRSDLKMTPEGAKLISGKDPKFDPELFARSQFEYYEKYVRPAYDRAGYNQTQRDRSNVLLAGRTGGAEWSLYDRQAPVMNKSVDAQRVAFGIDKVYGAAGGTLNGKIVDLHARFTNLMERLGEAVLPMAVKGLEILVPALTKLTDWVGKHPGQVAAFAKAAIVIGGALVGLGTVALAVAAGAAILAGGPVVVFAAGVGVVVGAITALVALNFGTLAKGFQMLYTQIAFMAEHPIRFISGERPADVLPNKPGGHWSNKFDPNFGTTRNVWVPDARPSAVPPPGSGQKPVQITTNLMVDGKKLATIISKFLAGGLGSNMAPTGRPDPGATLASPAAGYHR